MISQLLHFFLQNTQQKQYLTMSYHGFLKELKMSFFANPKDTF